MMTAKRAKTKLAQLKKIVLNRPPSAGGRWKGVPHSLLVSSFLRVMDQRGWKPDGLLIDTFDNEAGVAFSLSVKDRLFYRNVTPPVPTPHICVTASNGKDHRWRVYAGGYYDEVYFVIDESLGKRYEIDLELDKEVKKMLDWWFTTVRTHLKQTLDHLRACKVTEDEAAKIVLNVTGDKLIPNRYTGGVLKSFSRYQDKSLWSLMACMAKPIGLSPGHLQPRRLAEVFYRLPDKPKPDPVLTGV